MALRFLFLLLLIPFFSSAYMPEIGKLCKKEKSYELSGVLYQTSFYQGGVENPYPPQPFILPNYSLLVVEITNEELKPTVVGEIVSDNEGLFQIKLPPGKYGFVNSNEKHRLEIGQYLPRTIQSGNENQSSYNSWEITNNQPIEIINEAITDIHITNHQTTICYMCP